MAKVTRNRERGVALPLVLLTLLALSALTAALVAMSSTETTVNANYRSEEVALFAARAGLYEVTDRMMQTNAASIASSIPTVVPSATPDSGILYLINQTSATGTVAPWSITNKYADTELCHEGYTIAGHDQRNTGRRLHNIAQRQHLVLDGEQQCPLERHDGGHALRLGAPQLETQ